MVLSDLEMRKKELEQAANLHSVQQKYHASEAAKHERELAGILIRIDEIELGLRRQSAGKQLAKKEGKARRASARTSKSSSYQRFRTEGPTIVIVRLLYENRVGITNYEMQARNGIAIKGRMIRKSVNRLITSGCAIRKGKRVLLTDMGITAWEASPLFLHSSRNSRDQAASS
jgi:hypothetical protein